jgi:hypothetical protein
MVTLRQAFVESGYVVVRQACTPNQVAALRAEVDAARGELEKGGYRIWATAETLPPTLRMVGDAWTGARAAGVACRGPRPKVYRRRGDPQAAWQARWDALPPR